MIRKKIFYLHIKIVYSSAQQYITITKREFTKVNHMKKKGTSVFHFAADTLRTTVYIVHQNLSTLNYVEYIFNSCKSCTSITFKKNKNSTSSKKKFI